jgi:hypothetical protein
MGLWLGWAPRVLLLFGAVAGWAQSVPSFRAPPLTYSNLATAALLKRTKEISRSLSEGGFLPSESFSNTTVQLEGQSVHPSGRVQASCCDYEFRNGFLNRLRRRDLFEDKGPDSLIIKHLTSEVLTLTTQEATNRAWQVLERLSYDPQGVREVYRLKVTDEKMIGSPVRNGGPDFPADLHFAGELISRKKIQIRVDMAPADTGPFGERTTPTIGLQFLATSGELLEASLPDSVSFSALRLRGPEEINITQAADLAPPLFFIVTNRLAGAKAAEATPAVEQAVDGAWQALLVALGTNTPKLILVADNLNDPAGVSAAVQRRAGSIPWAGVSHFFRFDLPFPMAQLENLARERRGICLLAVAGPVDIRAELLRDLDDVAIPAFDARDRQAWQEAWKQLRQRQLELLNPRLSELLERLGRPEAFPDHALFLLMAKRHFPASLAEEDLQTRLRGKMQVYPLLGVNEYQSPGDGVTYFNGTVYSNAMAAVRLSGFLPLEFDITRQMALRMASLTNMPNYNPERLRMLQSNAPPRIISHEISAPVRNLAGSFGPQPLEELIEFFGLENIQMLRAGERLEVSELRRLRQSEEVPKSPTPLEGFAVVAQGRALGPESVGSLNSLLLSESNHVANMSREEWPSVIVFRVWRGKEWANVFFSFGSSEAAVKFYDASGKLIRATLPFFVSSRQAWLELARKALPESSSLAQADKPREPAKPSGIKPGTPGHTSLETKEISLGPKPPEWLRWEGWFALSEDMRHVAFRARQRDRWRIFRDGTPGKIWDAVNWHRFSRDGKHLAYAARESGQYFVVVDDKEGEHFSRIDNAFQFSPDSARLGYVATIEKGKQCVVVDGKRGPVFDAVVPSTLSFSDNSRHFAYAGRRGQHCVIVKDGEEVLQADEVVMDTQLGKTLGPVLSPDGARMACAIRRGGQWRMVLDGAESSPWHSVLDLSLEGPSAAFSPDGKHFSYVGERKDERFVVIDGNENPGAWLYAATFSPDGEHAAYVRSSESEESNNWCAVVLDGVIGKKFRGEIMGPVFSPDSKTLAYTLREGRDGEFLAVHGGKETEYYKAVHKISFSSDSKHMAFIANKEDQTVLVVDGKENFMSDSASGNIRSDYFTFSPDNKRIAYIAHHGGGAYVVVDGAEYGPYYELSPMSEEAYVYFSSDSRHFAFMANHDDNRDSPRHHLLVVDGAEQPISGEWLTESLLRWDSPTSLHGLVMGEDKLYLLEARIREK